jgi:hypothetical protein
MFILQRRRALKFAARRAVKDIFSLLLFARAFIGVAKNRPPR